jgi:hypothetical protein
MSILSRIEERFLVFLKRRSTRRFNAILTLYASPAQLAVFAAQDLVDSQNRSIR